jgi:hypothetical protein
LNPKGSEFDTLSVQIVGNWLGLAGQVPLVLSVSKQGHPAFAPSGQALLQRGGDAA